jgi:tRNA G18 (ribose-2'-O)-methylase SpoU
MFLTACVGKEKEGVPAELLNLLDFTVEIPQLGITRYN